MSEKTKLTPEGKLDILLHILDTVDEQNVISFAEDKFEAYFKAFSRETVEAYLQMLNNKKTLQFMIYGEPGMINEHFIKITSPEKISREIKLQVDMLKAKHKDMILAINEENASLRESLEKERESKKNPVAVENSPERQHIAEQVNDALDYSKKLSAALKKNKNLEVLDGVVTDTQGYLKAVKIISENYEGVNTALIEPLIQENRLMMRKLTLASAAAVLTIAVFSVMILTIFNY